MNCPACKEPLSQSEIVTSDKQKALIYECFNCGGHFVPPLIVNFIPEATAINLDSITPKNISPVSATLNCPVCQAVMVAIKDDAVPQGVDIYACPENHGHFFPSRQLYAFKRAQKSKLQYHQLWGIPIKSIFAIILPIIAVFTAVSVIPLTLEQIKQNQESRTKAGGLVSQPLVSPVSPTQVVISFTTPIATTTQITLTFPDGSTKIFPGVNQPQTTHVITLNDLTANTPYTYTITTGNTLAGPFSFQTPPP